jgi:hypothetical protein
MRRNDLAAKRINLFRELAETKKHMSYIWYLDDHIIVCACLENEKYHHSDKRYSNCPTFSIVHNLYDSDSRVYLEDLEPWQIQAVIRLKELWNQWCNNEIDSLPQEIGYSHFHGNQQKDWQNPWLHKDGTLKSITPEGIGVEEKALKNRFENLE